MHYYLLISNCKDSDKKFEFAAKTNHFLSEVQFNVFLKFILLESEIFTRLKFYYY